LLRLRERRLLRQAAIGGAALLLALLLTLALARSLTRSVARLVTGMGEVRGGRYDFQLEVRSRDEFGYLTTALNDLLGGVRERLALLRFVPRHTRAAVAESVGRPGADGRAFVAHKRQIAVFFSDIRGFTALSDELPPDRVIAMLNSYLRK